MRNVMTVFKKEIYRVISDKRLVLTVFIVPGLSIFLIYSLMGTIISSQMTEAETHTAKIYAEHLPSSIETIMDDQMRYEIVEETYTRDELETMILEGNLDLVMIFDEDFTAQIEAYQGSALPSIEVLYNQSEQHSQGAFSRFQGVMATFHEQVIIERLENPEDYQVYTLSPSNIMDERAAAGAGFAMLMPMLIVIFLFAGAMSIGPDAIAGEKERGTIATLLVRPVKRSSIALGKVLSLAVLSLLSALSSFIGIILSLPRLMQMDDNLPDVSIYGVSEYLLILALLMSTVLFIVALISILSAYAKTIKEASMLIMPFYFIAIIVGVMNSFGADTSDAALVHLIPIYGPINVLSGILMFDFMLINLIITILSSLLYTAILIVVLNKMFSSEKIMFQK